MALRPSLSIRQTQRLALTPAMRQGLSLLQLPSSDLLSELIRQAADNPLLLVREPRASHSAPDADAAIGQIAQPVSLVQSLCTQISLMPLPAPVARLAQYLTGDLTEDGYLDSSAEDLARSLNAPLALVDEAIAALQSCDPTGVAARDLAECLALQLIEQGVSRKTAITACLHLDLLAEGQLRRAARLTGLSVKTLESLAAIIRTLSPRPAVDFAEPTRLLIPEVTVEHDGAGGFKVSLNTGVLPDVHLDTALLAQIAPDSDLAQSYRRPAETLIRGLAFRAKTLLRVATALTTMQHRFFALGPDHMAPVTRVKLADTLGVHASTVGRALAGKALSFDGVVYPMEHFLSAALPLATGGHISAYAVQHRIRQLIAAEGADVTLSDEAVADILKREGVDIARRTVAKYRGCMKIPSSFERSRRKTARHARPIPAGDASVDQS